MLVCSSDRALGEAGSPPNPYALDRDLGASPPVPASAWGPLPAGAWGDIYRTISLPDALASPQIVCEYPRAGRVNCSVAACASLP